MSECSPDCQCEQRKQERLDEESAKFREAAGLFLKRVDRVKESIEAMMIRLGAKGGR